MKLLFIGILVLYSLSLIDGKAPLLDRKGPIIPGKYIVHLKAAQHDDEDQDSFTTLKAHSKLNIHQVHKAWLINELSKDVHSKLEHEYDFDDFVGYSGTFDKGLLDKIRDHPFVDFVEPDQEVSVFGSEFIFDLDKLAFVPVYSNSYLNLKTSTEIVLSSSNSGSSSSKVGLKPLIETNPIGLESIVVQNEAPWGLARISRRSKSDNGSDTFVYPASAGSGVDVYVIDTGIFIEHEEFEGRAIWGTTIPEFDMDIDGNGHGTHCAGVIGSKGYGVAKNVTLIAVKVLRTNGFGTNSDVIKGIEWVLNRHRLYSKRGHKCIVSMSLGGGRSVALEKAIEISVRHGVHFSVAAGNDAADACDYSPAGSKDVISVGASTIDDEMAYFSNIGLCVDIFAPGMDITSTWIGSKNAVNTISGTSMAAPHVAGALALYLAEKDLSPKELKDLIKKDALNNALTLIPEDTENRLLNICSLLDLVDG